MKSSTLLILGIVLALCAIHGEAQSHNSFWGQPYWNSTLAYSVRVTQKSAMLSTVTRTLQYPPPGIANYRPIVAIRAFDQKRNGNGAYASILSGGINSTAVTLRFKSQWRHGIDFIVEIFTR